MSRLEEIGVCPICTEALLECKCEEWEFYPPEPPMDLYKKLENPQWHPLYSVEFHRWKKGEPMHWRLFKKNFIYTPEQWDKMMLENIEDPARILMSPEGHPYQLANGTVNEHPNVICLETKEFLKYLVDALNAKSFQDEFIRGLIEDSIKRSKEKTNISTAPSSGQDTPVV